MRGLKAPGARISGKNWWEKNAKNISMDGWNEEGKHSHAGYNF